MTVVSDGACRRFIGRLTGGQEGPSEMTGPARFSRFPLVPIRTAMTASTLTNKSTPAELRVEDNVHDSLCLLADLYEYNHWTFSRVRPFLGDRVCDVGCGNGNFIQFLLDRKRVIGLDPFDPSLEVANRRFRDHTNVEFVCGTLADCPNEQIPAESFDSVVCMRLLDSLENDVESLSSMRRLCRSNGRVIIVASAHMSAYGELDRAVGHRRRYNRRSLRNAFESANLRVIHSSYINALGYFGWWFNSRILKRREIPAGPAHNLNRLAPCLDALERLVPPPLGQSILMVGTPS